MLDFRRNVEMHQRKPRIEAFEVDGVSATAAINIGSLRASLVDNGAGDYTLTFTDAFARKPMAVATSQTTGVLCEIAAISASSIQINCFDVATGAAATDAVFDLLVVGFDSDEEY